jgi:4'-phosphopantetheinyl transferase
MPYLDHHVSTLDFVQAGRRALAHCSFAVPVASEACVLLCDSTAWTVYAVSAAHLLDAGEQARAARFRFERDRVTYVLAHALWRTALGVCLGMEAVRVPLMSTPAGQPRLHGTGYATSLAHSGTWVAIAICADWTVGVDIERSPPRAALTQLMPFICTPAELADMERLPPHVRETALLMLWTRKEALLKAFGTGLMENPAQLSAMNGELIMPPPSVADQVPCRARNMESLPSVLVGALAVPASVATIRLHWLAGPQAVISTRPVEPGSST